MKRRARGTSKRKLFAEQLERRLLLAANQFGQNPIQPLDVTRDALVSSLDALRIINALREASILGPVIGRADPANSSGVFVDVTGDGFGSSLDALHVINALGSESPILAATLPTDSGPGGETNVDLLTNDYEIEIGVGAAELAGQSVMIRIDGEGDDAFTDITGQFSDSRATLTEQEIDSIFGGPVPDGEHHIEVLLDGSPAIDFPVFIDRELPELRLLGEDNTLRQSSENLTLQFSELVTDPMLPSDILAILESQSETEASQILSVVTSTFDTLDLLLDSPLGDADYRLRIGQPIEDLAGNVVASGSEYLFTVADPTGISAISPAMGEELVNPRREAIVRFDEPVNPATVTSDSFYLIANGGRVPGRVVVSSTQQFATFFYDDPLPPSTEVRIVLDGDQVIGQDGLAFDGDGDHVPGGMAVADFSTLPLTRIPNTNVFGYVRDSSTGDPLVGVTIRVDAFPGLEAVTVDDDPTTTEVDEAGRFELVDVPAPDFFVTIDGSTVAGTPDGFKYPTLGKPFHSVAGLTTQLQMDGEVFDIYLPLMAMGDVQTLSATESTDVGFGDFGKQTLAEMFPEVDPEMFDMMKVRFEPGSARDDAGNAANEASVIPVNPDRIPAPLPTAMSPSLVISIQAGTNGSFNGAGGATNFDIPAEVSFPNLDGMAAGEKMLIMSFDHDAGEWVVNGTATVSEDGMSVVSDPGVGILAPGWHFTISGSLPSVTPNSELSDRAEASVLSALSCLGPPQVLLTPIALLAAEYVESKFVSFGSDLGVSHLNHFLANTGTARNYANGSTISDLVRASTPFQNQNAVVLPYVKQEIQRLIAQNAPAGTNIAIPESVLNRAGGRIRFGFGGDPNLSWGIHGTQGLEIEGDVDVSEDGSSYSGTLTYTYYDTYGFGVNDTFFGSNNISYSGQSANTLMRHLQICGFAHWFPVYVTVEVPISSSGNKVAEFELQPQIYSFASAYAAEGEDLPAFSDSPGFGTDDSVYYHYEFVNGAEIRGKTQVGTPLSNLVVPPGVAYQATFYAPSVNQSTRISGITAASGSSFTFEEFGDALSLVDLGGLDSDGDDVPDIGESTIGTDPNDPDTDGDGISDSAELEQGLNPLDGIAATTGVQSSLDMPGSAEAVDTANDIAYVATGDHGLAIVDTSQFSNPIQLGQIELQGFASDVAIDASLDLVAVATGTVLEVVDVFDPMVPIIARTVSIPASHVEVSEGIAYVTGDAFLRVVDLTSGDVLQTLLLPGSGNVTGIAREADFLYGFESVSDTFFVVDLSNEGEAAIIGQTTISIASSDVGVFVGNGVAWLAGSGLRTVDVSDPTNPALISNADSFFSARRIALNGSGLGVLLPDGGNIAQLYNTTDSNTTDNFLTQFDLPDDARGIAISRGIAIVAADQSLSIVNYLPFDSGDVPPTVSIISSVEDVDPATAGLQVVEGGSITLRADVFDDVQVRNVELLVDGNVIRNDVSFPFDFDAIAIGDDPEAAAISVQLRATDTGGNSATSDPLLIDLVPDTFAPVIVSISPDDGEQRFQGQRTVRIRVNEPLAESSIAGSIFQVVDAGADELVGTVDDIVLPVETQLRDGGELVQLNFDPLTAGTYGLIVDQTRIVDRAGNALGVDNLQISFTVVEFAASPEFLPFGTEIQDIRFDDISVEIAPMPFDFEFFGELVTGPVYVTSNGIVEFFANTIGGTYTNQGLPDGSPRAVYGLWDDHYPPAGGRIGLFESDGVRAITWEALPHFSNRDVFASFQIAFIGDGTIQVRYGDIELGDSSATIGVADGSAAIVPAAGLIANNVDLAITDAQGLLNSDGLAALNQNPNGNDLLIFVPDGNGSYQVLHNPTVD